MFLEFSFERVASALCSDSFGNRVPYCPMFCSIVTHRVSRVLRLGVSVGAGVGDVLIALE